MDILVKIERFQIKPNVINLKSTLVNPFKLVHLLNSAQNVGLIRQLFAESVIMCF